jgi:two-component system NtrC family sensor kinase
VFDRGERWLDRAFAVNDWYMSGHESRADDSHHRVGGLYAGFPSG